ncbi:Crp/Fnr family transcriptional regulator [Flavobacterium caeni]|uniref:cAMP-binding domain of CRP or a regulatory subunit of cAMP-dependent protein kinases n=1 Tax=Flavobacterium caeni TaxID=490189 RepID=A0A1G5HW11_9FLAO|nr:Crp/Fnr family transcriptional regulator [Flavobacterium caeni]SCY67891.1 cAMP-binding domain of CRP or a regulatory subunit of cAMP-dependent protein kinases [Flavobacterium caeni]
MYLPLLDHIDKFVKLDHDERNTVLTYLDCHKVRKKEHVLKEGQVCNAQYFIVKGCFHQYIINEKGVEKTLLFGIENWWMTDFLSFQSHSPSNFYIQAIENSEVISIDKESLEDLLIRVPKLERYFRLCMQKSFGASQVRIKYLFTMSAEERYHHINTMFPEFVQRVPQYMLASYLDFSPEFLSKIRAGKV